MASSTGPRYCRFSFILLCLMLFISHLGSMMQIWYAPLSRNRLLRHSDFLFANYEVVFQFENFLLDLLQSFCMVSCYDSSSTEIYKANYFYIFQDYVAILTATNATTPVHLVSFHCLICRYTYHFQFTLDWSLDGWRNCPGCSSNLSKSQAVFFSRFFSSS